MKWRDMTVNGGRVSAEWQEEAWTMCQRIHDPANLEAALQGRGPVNGRDAPVPEDWSPYWYAQEIANRMRQKARKAGAIKMTGKPRHWVFA